LLLFPLFAAFGCPGTPSQGDAGSDAALGTTEAGQPDHGATDAPADSDIRDVREAPPDGSSDAPVDGVDAAGATCLGPCLEALEAECPRTAPACVIAKTPDSITTCYSNGVKQRLVQSGSTTIVTVNKTNGTPCFVITIPSTMSEDVADPAGTAIAHVDFRPSSIRFAVTCLQSGVTTQVDLTSPQCAAEDAETQLTCTNGPCAWP
jgi:hypothetical protein